MMFAHSTQNSRNRKSFLILFQNCVLFSSLKWNVSVRSIVLFREISEPCNGANDVVLVEPSNELKEALLRRDTMVNVSAIDTKSISNGGGPKLTVSGKFLLPFHIEE